jgi:hypothetical protein
MFSRKITGIMIILLLAAGIAITTTRCYDDKNEARVTIHLERNDLAAMGIQPQPEKHFIDRVLECFSTRAEASIGWEDIRTNNLALTITSPSFEKISLTLPAGTTTYSIVIPSSKNVKFTVTHEFPSMVTYTDEKNWGAHSTIDLGSGEQDINLKMIPMTYIISVILEEPIQVNWETANMYSTIVSYKLYRSKSADGDYEFIGTTSNGGAQTGTRYYYR